MRRGGRSLSLPVAPGNVGDVGNVGGIYRARVGFLWLSGFAL